MLVIFQEIFHFKTNDFHERCFLYFKSTTFVHQSSHVSETIPAITKTAQSVAREVNLSYRQICFDVNITQTSELDGSQNGWKVLELW